jgi:hypothetical protein
MVIFAPFNFILFMVMVPFNMVIPNNPNIMVNNIMIIRNQFIWILHMLAQNVI